MIKEIMRRRIAAQTKEYLAKGGVIEQVPRVIFCPANMPWARARGWDYTPWVKLGGPDFFAEQINLSEGCYMRKPAKIGDD